MSHGAPLLISRGWRLAPLPGFSKLSQTLGLKGLKSFQTFGALVPLRHWGKILHKENVQVSVLAICVYAPLIPDITIAVYLSPTFIPDMITAVQPSYT